MIICLLFITSSLYVDNHADNLTDTSHSLPSVEILGDLNHSVIVPQSLSGVELQRLNALSIADAIRHFSGVQIKDYGGVGGLKTLDVRGMGSNYTSVFYDGISVNNALNGAVDLGRFSLDNIEIISL
jgi:outer membrane receptor for ferrienterochelin and colicin